MHYLKRLKIILQSNKIFYILLIISIIYTFLFIKFDKYKVLNNKVYAGYITEYNIDGDKLSLVIKEKNKIMINYYFKTEDEKNNFNLTYGDYIKVYGKVSLPEDNRNFGLFNYRKYLLTKKIKYVVDSSKIELISKNTNIFYKIKDYIVKKIEKNNKTKNYIKAFVIGDKKEIDDNIITSYQYLGISHLLAVSGMHVSLISMVILKLLKKRLGNTSYLIVSMVLIFYLFLTNFTISMIRASFQFILFSINKIMKLKIKDINIILFLASLLLIYNPYYIYDAGFKFSFSISFSLILFKKIIERKNSYISKALTISLISFLVSIPILINNFNQINFLSIVYNIFYVPFVSFVIFPISLITLIIPYIDNIYIYFINIFENITLFLSNIKFLSFNIANIPTFIIPIYYIFLYSFIFRFKREKILILLIIFVVLINYKRVIITEKITFMDVGQGDSILIRIKDKNILIDTGGKISYKTKSWKMKRKNSSIASSILIPYLKKEGVKQIDYLILTHGDYDHMGESINLINDFKVNNVIFNNDDYNDLELELINELNKMKIIYYKNLDKLNINNNKLYFLNTKIYDNENDNSNVIYFTLNNYKFLFMGDAGVKKEKDILDKYNIKNIDFLKVGHHGSDTSSSKKFINNINPEYSIISVGKNNRYNHPKETVLDTLKNSKIYRTDINGSIEIKLNKNEYKIRMCLP